MPEMDMKDILKFLPHRYPMLLVDKIIECDGEKRIVGIKNVTMNEPFFQGHFPGTPIMPGVLQLEAMAQTAGILLNQVANEDGGGIPYFMAIDKAKFRRLVVPGDQLRMEVDLINMRARSAKFSVKGSVDGEVASQAEMLCMLADGEAS